MPGNPKQKQRSVLSSVLLFFLIIFLFLGILGGVRVWKGRGVGENKWLKARTEMGEVQKALNQDALDHDLKHPEKLEALTEVYFKYGVPKNPFTKEDYLYERTPTGFRLTCLGKDQNVGGDDEPDKDIVFNEKGVID